MAALWCRRGALCGAAAAYKRTLARCGCGMGVIILRYMAPVCKYEPLWRAVAWLSRREPHLCATSTQIPGYRA